MEFQFSNKKERLYKELIYKLVYSAVWNNGITYSTSFTNSEVSIGDAK
jgi:hypothetical protein